MAVSAEARHQAPRVSVIEITTRRGGVHRRLNTASVKDEKARRRPKRMGTGLTSPLASRTLYFGIGNSVIETVGGPYG